MKTNPLVSIVALNYNNANYVISTLESIAHQDYDNYELIIVDDYSTDDSLRIIKEWIPTQSLVVNLVAHGKNLGVCAACNSGIRKSSGKYVSLIATDDIMMPCKTRIQVEALEISSENVCAVFSDMTVINEQNVITEKSYFDLLSISYDFINNVLNRSSTDQLTFLVEKNILPAPAIMYKKEVIIKLGGWDEKIYFEDLDMNLRLIHSGYSFIYLSDKLVKYRMMSNSLTRRPNPLYWETFLTVIYKYYGISKELDNSINNKIQNYSHLIFQLSGKESSIWLKRSLINHLSLKSIIYLICSSLRIRYKYSIFVKTQFLNTLKRVKHIVL
ncbi:MAG: glycosyltransferase family 2 protein [Janthinobacterium lividum]